jgi:hypothetical protein
MSELVAALLGIVAGGLLTGAVDLFKAYRERRALARTAARLIFADRDRALSVIYVAVEKNDWWNDPLDEEMRAVNWSAYRDRLAAGIPAHDFTTIDGAFFKVGALQRGRAAGVKFADMQAAIEDTRLALVDAGGRILKASHSRRDRRMEAREPEPLTDYPV